MNAHYSTRGLGMVADLEKYANGKLGRLSRKVPRRFRAGATCNIAFSQTTSKGNKLSTCRVVLSLAGKEMKAEGTTPHIYAALDIAVVDIERQLKDYVRQQRRSILRRRRTTED